MLEAFLYFLAIVLPFIFPRFFFRAIESPSVEYAASTNAALIQYPDSSENEDSTGCSMEDDNQGSDEQERLTTDEIPDLYESQTDGMEALIRAQIDGLHYDSEYQDDSSDSSDEDPVVGDASPRATSPPQPPF